MSVEQASPVNFKDSAAIKVKELIESEGDMSLCLRVYISGGGCSGFQYGFSFEKDIKDDDIVVEKMGVKLLIDSMSFQYLVGADIDFKEDVNGAFFTINNPNAKTTCSCGSSFSA